MTDHDLEGRIRSAMEHAAPDKLDAILSSCGEQKGTVIPMTKKKKNRWAAPLAAAAALVLMCGGALGVQTWQNARTVDSVVMLDVNPSLALNVNAKEKVLSVNALNDDAKAVLGDMDLRGTDLDVAVNALIGSMLRNGYLSEVQNSILVSVENDDAVRSAVLQAKVTESISQALSGDAISGAVLSQTVSAADEELACLALQYGVSLGKAALIQEVVAQDPTLTFAGLAPMSVNEIALITASRDLSTQSVTRIGTASDKAYIGQDAALSAACAHAGVPVSAAVLDKVEFDSDDGLMVYEVEFYAGGLEYEYDIDARTGGVVKFKTEQRPSSGPSVPSSGAAYVGESAAQAAALAHAGVSQASASYLACWLEYDDGRPEHYEVEFTVGATRYEYEIDLYTGAVLKSEQETYTGGHHSGHHDHDYDDYDDDDFYSAAPVPAPPADPGYAFYIGESAAQSAALAHAGVTQAAVYDLKVELDLDDDGDEPDVYDVEFKVGAMEYEYEIDAYTGAVLKWDQDLDD